MIPVKVLFSLPWIGAAALMAKFVSSWNELPERIATHFGLSGEPNGWMNKAPLAAVMIVVVLVLCGSTIPVMSTDARKSDTAIFALLLSAAAVVGGFWEMIDYNLSGEKFSILRAMLPMTCVGALLLFNHFTKLA
ncbi:MAG: DUF1648 domain-containing protein [Candidatus Acidiferrales bacterium]